MEKRDAGVCHGKSLCFHLVQSKCMTKIPFIIDVQISPIDSPRLLAIEEGGFQSVEWVFPILRLIQPSKEVQD